MRVKRKQARNEFTLSPPRRRGLACWIVGCNPTRCGRCAPGLTNRFLFGWVPLVAGSGFVVGVGVYYLLSQLGFGDDPAAALAFCMGVLGACGVGRLLYLVYEERQEIQLLTNALQLVGSCDKDLLKRLREAHPDFWSTQKDMPLALVAERRGLHAGLPGPSPSGTDIIRLDMADETTFGHPLIETVRDAITTLPEPYASAYSALSKLDSIIIRKLPRGTRKSCARSVYFLRLHILDDLLDASLRGEKLEYIEPTEEEMPVYEFLQVILDGFYEGEPGYPKRPGGFDVKALERYLDAGPHAGDETRPADVRITDDCTGCGLCVETCPEVFDMGDKAAEVIVDGIPEEYWEAVREAADECPAEAIVVEAGS